MHAEEVNFGALEGLGANSKRNGNTRYKRNEFSRFSGADANVPVFSPAWGFKRPGT